MPSMRQESRFSYSHLMWSNPDVVGLFSINVVSFSRNVVLRRLLFSRNSVSKPRMLSVRADYVLSSLHIRQKSRTSTLSAPPGDFRPEGSGRNRSNGENIVGAGGCDFDGAFHNAADL